MNVGRLSAMGGSRCPKHRSNLRDETSRIGLLWMARTKLFAEAADGQAF